MASRSKFVALAAIPVLFALTGCFGGFETEITRAGEACGYPVSDKGHSIIFDMTEESEDQTSTIICILQSLDTPDSTFAKIGSTTALMGVQTDSWRTDNGTVIVATWTYHPENGLDVIIEG